MFKTFRANGYDVPQRCIAMLFAVLALLAVGSVAGPAMARVQQAPASRIAIDLPDGYEATRYHSLVVDRATLPADLTVTAATEAGLIMGLAHRTCASWGVQFHHLSIAAEHGKVILKNFLDLAARWNGTERKAA